MGVKAEDANLTKMQDEANQQLENFIDALAKAGADLAKDFSWATLSQMRIQAGKPEITSDFSDILSAYNQAKMLATKLQNTLSG